MRLRRRSDPDMMWHHVMLQRNLLNTGVSTGSKLVVPVGKRRAIGMAVRGIWAGLAWSKLAEWLA